MAKQETLKALLELGGSATCGQLTGYIQGKGHDLCRGSIYGDLLKLETEGTLYHNRRTRVFRIRNCRPARNVVVLEADGTTRPVE